MSKQTFEYQFPAAFSDLPEADQLTLMGIALSKLTEHLMKMGMQPGLASMHVLEAAAGMFAMELRRDVNIDEVAGKMAALIETVIKQFFKNDDVHNAMMELRARQGFVPDTNANDNKRST